MLNKFKNQSLFNKTSFIFCKIFHFEFSSVKSLHLKHFTKKFDLNFTRKFISYSPTLFQGAEKSQKKFIYNSINEYIKLPVKTVEVDKTLKVLVLNFDGAVPLEYPVVWLRDNCQCAKCFDPVSNSRIHGPLSFTNDVIPKFVTLAEESVLIYWEDEHRSQFPIDWLCRHSFQIDHQAERLNNDSVHQVLWDAENFEKLISNICFKFDDLISDDKCLLKWLETLASVGIAKISGVPLEIGQLIKLGNRVSFIRKTHYGEEYYIKGESNANNVAYQKGPLQMHTDLPYYNYSPGVVLLHYIVQSRRGGENILADGFGVAKQLSQRNYEVLATTLVDWLDIGFEKNKKFFSVNRAPVICENYSGNVERINWSQPQRNSIFNVSIERAALWYNAFQEFSMLLHNSKNVVNLKISEGNVLAFDNRRIVHGRTNYTDERFLCGAYLDWDEIYSRIRVLRQGLKNEKIYENKKF